MRTCRNFFSALFCAAILAGCSKSPPPPPDGSSGLRGIGLLPAEPPDEDGKVPHRRRWVGVVVIVRHTNHSSSDPTWNLEYRATADADGKFEIALNPGDYVFAPHDPKWLNDMAITPQVFKVEPGRYTEVVMDYDKLNMRKVRLNQP